MKKQLSNNWLLKLIALALAIATWIYVNAQIFKFK